MTVGIVISTFRRPEALSLVLTSLVEQEQMPSQVIVVDDGSGPTSRAIVDAFDGILKIIYVWQPDSGFRLARARNLGAAVGAVDYLIFIDGDCVLPKNFVRVHAELAEVGAIVFGSRRLLSKEKTADILASEVPYSSAEAMFKGRKFCKLPLGFLRFWPRRKWESARGFMLAIHRQAYLKICGFDEAYVSWGLEDSDFVIRCLRAGMFLKDSRYATSCLHLWHLEKEGLTKSPNTSLFKHLLAQNDRMKPIASSLGV
jgi:glycosyltransferase involved in cell wall biosynthesis